MSTQPNNRSFATYVNGTLKGAGQVMFQGSAWTGLLIIIGIFAGCYLEAPYGEHMPVVAWGALAGLIVSTATGYIFESKTDGDQGLWGFNGILVGCAVFTFLDNTVWSWIAMIIGSALTVVARRGLNNVFAPFKTTSYTFPFILISWLILLSARDMAHLTPAGESIASLPTEITSGNLQYTFTDIVVYWLKGISQVFLVNSWITGIFFIVGLALCSRWAAFWAMLSAAVALFMAIFFGASHPDITEGLYGFSPVLTGIAVGCTFYKPGLKSFFYSLSAVVFTVFVQFGMDILLQPVGLATLTAPFCIATWIFMLPMYKLQESRQKSAH
ncbi:urea transporter [Muribaculum intestinale]|uniref:urea transporter n=2 Tax=Muribaculum intestinale TaxID=1796646 RepID=UPI0025A60028|nr:urea transporter [Muribaculum intestinale]